MQKSKRKKKEKKDLGSLKLVLLPPSEPREVTRKEVVETLAKLIFLLTTED